MSRVILGDIAISQTGPFGSQLHEEDYVSEGTPIVTVEHLGDTNFTHQNLPFVSEADTKRLSKYILIEGDIVFSRVGSIDRNVYVDKNHEGWMFSGRCIRVRADKNKVNPRYLSYYFKQNSFKKMMMNLAVGATMPSLNTKIMNSIELDLLPRENQDKIANILSAIDDKIQINNQINQELEAMAKTLYDYWFVQFDFPDQNGKPYKSSGGKMIYNPELKREIPEGWGVARLGELQITTGKRDANFGTENGKYDFWTTSNNPIKSDEFSFEGKAILIAGNGNFYVNFTEGKFEAYQRTYVIQSEDENMLIFMYMACLQSVEKLRKGSNGSIIKYITIGDVNNIVSPYNKKVVDEFVKVYSPLIDLISKNKIQNQELTQLRDWLLPMLMNGQVKME